MTVRVPHYQQHHMRTQKIRCDGSNNIHVSFCARSFLNERECILPVSYHYHFKLNFSPVFMVIGEDHAAAEPTKSAEIAIENFMVMRVIRKR